MDWALAIDRNRAALTAIIAGLVAMAGTAGTVTRAVHSAICAILRPAESAVRRLILIAAHGVEAQPLAPHKRTRSRESRSKRAPSKAFQLFDRRKRFNISGARHCRPHQAPRVLIFYDRFGEPYINPNLPQAPQPSDLIPASSLGRRLSAITNALANLPKEAQRMANWKARRAAMKETKFRDPLRPGRPPGWRMKRSREVDELLWECAMLAVDRQKSDTS